MAKKRDKHRESIFVTNEYFEKCGVSRQVVRYSIEKKKIKPAGSLIARQVVEKIVREENIESTDGFIKSPMLYYQRDADYLILLYWIESYKRYLKGIDDTWQELKGREPYKNWGEEALLEFRYQLLEGDEHVSLLPPVIAEFKEVVKKYHDYSTRQAHPGDPFCETFSSEYTTGIAQRNERFFLSGKDVETFMTMENKNRFAGKKHLDVIRELKINRWFKKGDHQKIEGLLSELEQRKNSPPLPNESPDFYDKALDRYQRLKRKKT